MGHGREATDAELLRDTAADPLAFDAFYARYERPLLAYFGARTRDPELAADLTAEVFAAALGHAAAFDPGRPSGANAAPWLFAIAHNTLMTSLRRGRVATDARRRAGMRERLPVEDDAYARIDAVASLGVDLGPLLATLPEPQRVALLARVVDERDYPEIAAELRCSELVVRKRVSRALSTLRAAIPTATVKEPS